MGFRLGEFLGHFTNLMRGFCWNQVVTILERWQGAPSWRKQLVPCWLMKNSALYPAAGDIVSHSSSLQFSRTPALVSPSSWNSPTPWLWVGPWPSFLWTLDENDQSLSASCSMLLFLQTSAQSGSHPRIWHPSSHPRSNWHGPWQTPAFSSWASLSPFWSSSPSQTQFPAADGIQGVGLSKRQDPPQGPL